MRYVRAAVPLLATLAVGAPLAAQGARRESAAAAEVRDASRALDAALVRGDTAAVARFYAADYIHVDRLGVRTGKAERLAELGSGARRFQALPEGDSVRYAAGRDVVVASARTQPRATLNRRPVGQGAAWASRVWARRDGRWQILLAQTTPIAAAPAAAGAPAPDADQQEVLAVSRALQDANRRNDADALGRIYADDCIFTTYRGTTSDRRGQLEAFRSGRMVFDSLSVSDERVRVYGDAAVVTLRRRQVARMDGQPRPTDVRVTETFVRRDGRWQLVAGQVTPILP